jgi:hypothetical protein
VRDVSEHGNKPSGSLLVLRRDTVDGVLHRRSVHISCCM